MIAPTLQSPAEAGHYVPMETGVAQRVDAEAGAVLAEAAIGEERVETRPRPAVVNLVSKSS